MNDFVLQRDEFWTCLLANAAENPCKWIDYHCLVSENIHTPNRRDFYFMPPLIWILQIGCPGYIPPPPNLELLSSLHTQRKYFHQQIGIYWYSRECNLRVLVMCLKHANGNYIYVTAPSENISPGVLLLLGISCGMSLLLRGSSFV